MLYRPSAHVDPAAVEPLERRMLLAAQPFVITEAAISGGTELRVTGTAANDRIEVSQTVEGLIITSGTWSKLFAKDYKSLLVDGGAGNDVITLDSSVTVPSGLKGGLGNDSISGGEGNDRIYGGAGTNTLFGAGGDDILVTVGGATNDKLIGGLGKDSYWLDADSTETITDVSPTEAGIGAVHRVSEFANSKQAETTYTNVKKTMKVRNAKGKLRKVKVIEQVATTKVTPASKELLGQNLLDPTLTKAASSYKNFNDRLLFADGGPRLTDIHQGQVGTCYYLAVLASIAKTNPEILKQTIVDLGDGTYAVQFQKAGSIVHVRVDADLPVNTAGSLAYANFSTSGSLWVALLEKAWASFRTNSSNYASIDGGWMDESYRALGVSSASIMTGTAQTILAGMFAALDAGKSVTFAVATPPAGSNLVGFHAYMVDRVNLGSDGKPVSVRLANPWGIDGPTTVDGVNDGFVTITGDQAAKALLGYTVGSYA